mgnify:CR=1 FL=1
MGQEIEYKLAMPDAETLGNLRRAFSGQGAEETSDYETVYFDLGAELNARRFMFRARERGGAAVYTVKTPGEGCARGEWECEAASPQEAAKKLADLGAPREIAERTAFPVTCGASFTRTAITIDREDAVIELAFDLGELTAPGASAPVCELELELKSGPLAPMTALRDEIMQKYGLRELKKSKYARARALTGAK